MRITKNDKIMALNPDIRKKYPRGIATIVKSFRASNYYNLTAWDLIDEGKVGDIVNPLATTL